MNTRSDAFTIFLVSRFLFFPRCTLYRRDPLELINCFVYQTISINVVSVEFIHFSYISFSFSLFRSLHAPSHDVFVNKLLLMLRDPMQKTPFEIVRYFCATIKNACRHSTTSSTRSRTSYGRSYDLYDAQTDATREQRTQYLLGTMAACEIICIGPLMVLRWVFQYSLPSFIILASTYLCCRLDSSIHPVVLYLYLHFKQKIKKIKRK